MKDEKHSKQTNKHFGPYTILNENDKKIKH